MDERGEKPPEIHPPPVVPDIINKEHEEKWRERKKYNAQIKKEFEEDQMRIAQAEEKALE